MGRSGGADVKVRSAARYVASASDPDLHPLDHHGWTGWTNILHIETPWTAISLGPDVEWPTTST